MLNIEFFFKSQLRRQDPDLQPQGYAELLILSAQTYYDWYYSSHTSVIETVKCKMVVVSVVFSQPT